jgi:hypothetical protein
VVVHPYIHQGIILLPFFLWVIRCHSNVLISGVLSLSSDNAHSFLITQSLNGKPRSVENPRGTFAILVSFSAN